jgi:hypothetical protein
VLDADFWANTLAAPLVIMQLEDPAANVEIVVNLQENRSGSNILAARLGLSVFAQLVVAKLLQKKCCEW